MAIDSTAPRLPTTSSGDARLSRPRSLARLAWLFLWRPRRAIDDLAGDPRALGLGIWFLLLVLPLYAGVAGLHYGLGHHPASTPLTLFPAEDWYLVQAFITIPIGVLAAFAYSGIAYAVCRAFGGTGGFDATFGSSAFCVHLPMLIFMWIPELLVAPALYARGSHALPWPAWIELLRIFLIPLPWAGIVSALALSRIHRLAWWKAALAMLAGAAPTSLVTAAFLR